MCRGSDSEQDKQSKIIEDQLRKDRKASESKVKLLLLGTGESGKSTFLKQLKVIHAQGFSELEYSKFRTILQENSLGSMQLLLGGLEKAKIKLTKSQIKLQEKIAEATELDKDIAAAITALWEDSKIKDLFQRRNELGLQVPSAAIHWFKKANDFANPAYTLEQSDIFYSRIKTTGMTELVFNLNGIEFTIVDVGGQRSERRKWLHCFDNVTSVIYLAALDEYDMTLEEDNKTNRMEESLKLFQEVSGSQWFKATSWILFLNKSDLFKEKLASKPLSKYFPNEGAPEGADFDTGVKFIQKKYETAFKGQRLYPFTTCAIDTDNCRKVFAAVRDSVISGALQTAGF